MAMIDNPAFLISHIRNSFITSDDTGMCELIIESDEVTDVYGVDKRPTTWHAGNCLKSGVNYEGNSGNLNLDTELAHSCDIIPDMDFGAHRRRSNTAQRLEKLKRERQKQSQIKHIQWKEANCSDEDFMETFIKQSPKKPIQKSALSELLCKMPAQTNIPFMEFAKYDGRVNAGTASTKKIDIYLTMLPKSERGFPMTVVTLTSAKVHHLIGLICWQYGVENRQPKLKNDLDIYHLHIAEDDGEVDMDFPPLDKVEPISKFGFTKLALVAKDTGKSDNKQPIVVTVNMPDRGFTRFTLENETTTLKEILDLVIQRRKLKEIKDLAYRLEKQEEKGVALPLDTQIGALKSTEFCLIRENSNRGDEEPVQQWQRNFDFAGSFYGQSYKPYIVNMCHKLRNNTEVHLSISYDQIEINPVTSKGKFFKQKSFHYNVTDIVSCQRQDKKSDKTSFKLIFKSGEEFKHHTFESDEAVTNEIVQKINDLLSANPNSLLMEYNALYEKRLKARGALSLPR